MGLEDLAASYGATGGSPAQGLTSNYQGGQPAQGGPPQQEGGMIGDIYNAIDSAPPEIQQKMGQNAMNMANKGAEVLGSPLGLKFAEHLLIQAIQEAHSKGIDTTELMVKLQEIEKLQAVIEAKQGGESDLSALSDKYTQAPTDKADHLGSALSKIDKYIR